MVRHFRIVFWHKRRPALPDISLLDFCLKVVRVGLFAEAKGSKYTGNYQDCEQPNPSALDQSQSASSEIRWPEIAEGLAKLGGSDYCRFSVK
jgi:hypothetical protein